MIAACIHVNLYVCFAEEKIIVMSDIPFFVVLLQIERKAHEIKRYVSAYL